MARFGKFFASSTKSGKKVFGSIHPELKAASTKDKFVLNDVARKLLDVRTGKDRIILFDLAGKEGVDSNEKRFFVCKGGVDANGVTHGALLGKNGTFSYSEIWSAYQMQKLDVTAARPDDMVAAGRVIRTDVEPVKDKDGSIKLDKDGKSIMTGGAIIATQMILGRITIAHEPNSEFDPELPVDNKDNPEFVELRNTEVEEGLFADIYSVTGLREVAHDPRVEEADDAGLNENESTDDEGSGVSFSPTKATKVRK